MRHSARMATAWKKADAWNMLVPNGSRIQVHLNTESGPSIVERYTKGEAYALPNGEVQIDTVKKPDIEGPVLAFDVSKCDIEVTEEIQTILEAAKVAQHVLMAL